MMYSQTVINFKILMKQMVCDKDANYELWFIKFTVVVYMFSKILVFAWNLKLWYLLSAYSKSYVAIKYSYFSEHREIIDLPKATQYKAKIQNLPTQILEPTLLSTILSSDGIKKGKAFRYFGTINTISNLQGPLWSLRLKSHSDK